VGSSAEWSDPLSLRERAGAELTAGTRLEKDVLRIRGVDFPTFGGRAAMTN